jgi:hypothetical protein
MGETHEPRFEGHTIEQTQNGTPYTPAEQNKKEPHGQEFVRPLKWPDASPLHTGAF